jgi:16S rRNA (cytidine1402-2'-O)-methyltransferase
MNRQHSFENEKPTLYLVPTPIGNLNEMTPRALDILKSVDIIACEDTRTSGQMLKHFEIESRLIAYHNFNEEASANGILELLSEGKNIALISDAGYPLINDPGQRVVAAASSAGYNVVPVSGASAFLNAIVASGLVVQPFIFIGFLPQQHTDRLKKLREYKAYPMTMVFYESPHRIDKCLQDCLDVFGDRQMVLARELTKIHEEFLRGKISEILPVLPELKGEMVIVIDGSHEDYEKDVDMNAIMDMVQASIDAGLSTKDAIKEAAVRTGIAKNRIYEEYHSRSGEC